MTKADWDVGDVGMDEDEAKRKRRMYLKRKIRQGILPPYVFAKGRDMKLERWNGKLTWRLISVFEAID